MKKFVVFWTFKIGHDKLLMCAYFHANRYMYMYLCSPLTLVYHYSLLSFLSLFSIPIPPSSSHFLFPFLLLLIFCSHSLSYPHTLILQSISVSCLFWSQSVIMLWTQPVFCCMHSHRVWPGMCLLDSIVRWMEITGYGMWYSQQACLLVSCSSSYCVHVYSLPITIFAWSDTAATI